MWIISKESTGQHSSVWAVDEDDSNDPSQHVEHVGHDHENWKFKVKLVI